MAIFTINTGSKEFYVENILTLSTECSTIYEYEIFATDLDEIVVTLNGDHVNETYNLNGVTSTFSNTSTIIFNESLIIRFALSNSNNPGYFDNTILTIENNDSSVPDFIFDLERENDSADCASGGSGGPDSYISNVELSGTDLTFTGVIDGFDGVIDLSSIGGFTPDTLFNDYGFTDNSSNWDTAYSWGDHSTQGYLTSYIDTNDYVDSLAFNSGTGVLTLGRTGSLPDLTASIIPATIVDIPTTQIIELGNIGTDDIWDAWNAHTFIGSEEPIQDQIDGYVLINAIQDGLAVQYLFTGVGGSYGVGSGTTVLEEDEYFSLINSDELVNDLWRNSGGSNKAYTYGQHIRHGGIVQATQFKTNDGPNGGIRNSVFDDLYVTGTVDLILRHGNPNNGTTRITSNGAINYYDADRYRYNLVAARDYTSEVVYTPTVAKTLVGIAIKDSVSIKDAFNTDKMDYAALLIKPTISGGSELDRIYSIYSEAGRTHFGGTGDFTISSLAAPSGLDYMVTVDDTGLLSRQIIPGGGGGSGTVTSVAVSGSNGIEIDSGSPITTSGTIALGIDKATLLTHINVEDGAQVNVLPKQEQITGTTITATITATSHVIDLSLGTIFKYTLDNVAALHECAFTFSNLPAAGKNKVINIYLDTVNDTETFTFPVAFEKDPDSADFEPDQKNRITIEIIDGSPLEADYFIKNLG